MLHRTFASLIVTLAATAGFIACSDDSPVAPSGTDLVVADVATTTLTPFTFRAPLDPYRIQQLPNFMMHSKATTDIVIQRSVFAPGAGMWHTHPGPSFVYVIEGAIKLERFTRKDGCTASSVFGPGNAYFEVADEVHRAVVVSDAIGRGPCHTIQRSGRWSGHDPGS